jgi:Cupin domain
MHIPPGGGPPPHRHDFEEMFSVLEGEIEATFRGKKTIIRAGETLNISSVRTSPIPKQERAIGATAMSVLAGRAGRVF